MTDDDRGTQDPVEQDPPRGQRSPAQVLDDMAAALDAARRELVVGADGATEVLGRMHRDDGLVEIRVRAAQAEDLQDQLHVTLGRATDAAELTMDRLRRDGEQLRVLAGHPDRAREHLDAAAEFFTEIDQITSGPAAMTDGDRDVWSAQVQQLRRSVPLVDTAVTQVARHLQDSQRGVEDVLENLTSVTDDLRTGTGPGLPVGVPARVGRLDELVGQAQTGVRTAALSGEAGGQHAYVAAAVAAQAGRRLDTAQRNTAPPGPGRSPTRPFTSDR